jgi:GTP-binding protein
MNKWDIVEKDSYTILEFENKLKEDLKFMDYYVSLYASALTGKRIEKLMDLVNQVYEKSSYRISTGNLNEILQNAILTNEPPTQSGRRLKIKYITQGGTNPPTFILFVNNKELMHFSYLRYLENCIRKAVDFTGTPIKLFVKDGKEKE